MHSESRNLQSRLGISPFDVKVVQPKFNWDVGATQAKSSRTARETETPQPELKDEEARELMKGQIACLFGLEGKSFSELNAALEKLGLA